MTRSAFDFLRQFIAMMWSFFNSIYIPGTNVTPATLALFVLFTFIVIKTIKRLTNTTYHDNNE